MGAAESPEKPISLFYSYSHRDEKLRDQLEEHLGGLRRKGLIEEWHDRSIGAGTEWKHAIDDHLATADIVLLLISSSFINSDYCWDKEMRKALERHDKDEARVIPVLLRPCDWQDSLFAKLEIVPHDAKAITTWPDPDEAFVQVVEAIHRAVADLQKQRRRAAERAQQQREHAEARKRQAAEEQQREALQRQREQEEARKQAAARAPVPAKLRPLTGTSAAAVYEAVRQELREAQRRREQDEAGRPFFRDGDAPWCPEMVTLQAGEFLMGSPESEGWGDERPQHRVAIGYRFALGRFPVTFDEYDDFCAATRREKPGDQGWGRGRRPAINVSWRDAQSYVEWLAEATGKPCRLPSEAEWEFACRAGTTTHYAFGNAITPEQANYGESRLGKTRVVGAYSTNPWVLDDMHGNVWEWVEDVWHESYMGAPTDGSAWTDGEGHNSSRSRVFRGGCWYVNSKYLRSAARFRNSPEFRSDILGFRVARTLD